MLFFCNDVYYWLLYVCVSVTFWGLVRNFEDEMGGFKKSAKATHTPTRVPFQTKTRRTKTRAAAENATAETVAVNTTDTDTITATENLIPLVTRTRRLAHAR